MNRLQLARRGAHTPQARVLRHLPRQSARGGVIFAHMRKKATCWKLRLAHRSAAVHRGRGPSRWHSGLPQSMDRLQPARHGGRTAQVRVLRLLPRESARWRVRVCAHANAGCSLLEAAAGTSEHGRAPRERAVSLARWAFIGQGPTPTTRRGARTQQARVLRPLESYLLEAAAGTSERGRAPRERAVSLAQWAFIGHGPTPTSATRRAHTASARAAPP